MSESTNNPSESKKVKPEKKPGLLGRMVQKLDDSMKQKAEEKSQQSSCCGSDNDSNNSKCC